MSCGMYINYAMLANNLKVGWMEHYKNTHPEEEQLPIFILEGINEVCNRLACLVNGDPLSKNTWAEIGNLTAAVTQCIDMHNEHKNSNEATEEAGPEETTDV